VLIVVDADTGLHLVMTASL